MSEFGAATVGDPTGDPDYDELVWDQANRDMRVASGQVNHESPLVAFLYLLARDAVALGDIEDLVRSAIIDADEDKTQRFTNGWLAEWAIYTAARLGVDVHP